MEQVSFWGRLQDAASRPDEGVRGLWAWLKEKLDLAQYQPEAAPGVVSSRLTGRDGEYYVLKNPAAKTYYRLSDRDYFLWQLMDGSRTVKELVVAYFLEYGSFAFARVAALVQGLKASLLLSEQPVNVYRQVRSQLERRQPGHRLSQVWQAFLQTQLALTGLDPALSGIYRWGGRLLFTKPMQILYLAVSAVGFYAFIQAFRAGQYGVVTIAGSLKLGIIGLIVANLASIFVHEMAHALTVKHYGREVRRGGFMLYFGMPAFFVDTTDIWLEGKRARLAVTWAGPYSGLILGGLAGIVIALWPDGALNPLLFQFAFLAYVLVFFNLNPLLQLDGYYLLMDWLEIPLLRQKSLEFVRSGLWLKIKKLRQTPGGGAPGQPQASAVSRAFGSLRSVLASLSREEKIFAVFGLLSALWTGYAIYLGASMWQQKLVGSLRDLWTQGGDLGKMLVALGMAALSLLFVLSIGMALLGFARKILHWLARTGLFANTWSVAALLWVLAAGLAWAPDLLGYPILFPLLGLAALAVTAVFAWRNAADYAGSRLAPMFWLIGLFSLVLMLRLGLSQVAGAGILKVNWQALLPGSAGPALIGQNLFGLVSAGLGHVAYILLFLAGLLLFADTNLRELQPVEKLLMALGLVATYGLVLWLASSPAQPNRAEALLALSGSMVPLLFLTLLVPTLFSFSRTSFGPAWVTLTLSLAGWVALALLGLPPLLPYLLLAAGLALHHLAYRYVSFLKDQPQAAVDLSDARRLQRAFSWTVTAVVAQFRQMAGERPARFLAERFNSYALAAGWRISLVRGQVEDALPEGFSLIEGGEVYAAGLTLLLQLVAQEVGEKLTVRALQKAYDGLPWEEREIGSQYLFRHVERAEALGEEFQTTQRDYRALLRRMPLFATMDEGEIDLLCSRLRPEQVAAGQVIIRQGAPGDRFYIVERGHVEVIQRDERGVSEVVNQLDRGDYFGEVALLRDAPRNATCRATVPTQVLSLSREDFHQLVKARFGLREKVDRSILQAELLRKMPLFAEMDAQQIRLVAAQLQTEEYQPGETIIRQGEIGETFYVIESGRVQVSVTQEGAEPGAEKVVAERGPGEYIGEIALLLRVPRTATVRALTATRVLVLHRHDFDQLVAEHLYIGRGLERETSRRMLDLQRAD